MIHGRKLTVAERVNALGWLGTVTSDGGATFSCMNHGEVHHCIALHVSPIMGVELEEVIEDFLDHWWVEHVPNWKKNSKTRKTYDAESIPKAPEKKFEYVQASGTIVLALETQKTFTLEQMATLCECGHTRKRHSSAEGKCTVYDGDDPCQCPKFSVSLDTDG